MGRVFFVLGCAIAIFVVPLSAAAPQATLTDNWLPHSENADWVYQWSDSDYSSSPTKEEVTVKETKARSFTLAWSSADQGNAADAPVSIGEMSFQSTAAGLFNTGWSSSAPPSDFPILCARAAGCNNTIAAT